MSIENLKEIDAAYKDAYFKHLMETYGISSLKAEKISSDFLRWNCSYHQAVFNPKIDATNVKPFLDLDLDKLPGLHQDLGSRIHPVRRPSRSG